MDVEGDALAEFLGAMRALIRFFPCTKMEPDRILSTVHETKLSFHHRHDPCWEPRLRHNGAHPTHGLTRVNATVVDQHLMLAKVFAANVASERLLLRMILHVLAKGLLEGVLFPALRTRVTRGACR